MDEAMQIAKALRPMVDAIVDERTRLSVQSKKMTVTTAPNGTVIGVTEAFGTEVLIPYVAALANATIGQGVWVRWYLDDMSTAVAFSDASGAAGILPISAGGTGASTASGALSNLGVVDWVIEEGTSGIWNYRRWQSGTAECWGRVTCTNVRTASAWGSIYESATVYGDVDYPFTFDSIPTQTMQISGTTLNAFWLNPPNGSSTGANNTTTNTGKWNFSRPTAVSTGRIVYVDIYVRGIVTI